MLDEILGDDAGLRQDERLSSPFGLNAKQWGFAKRVNLFELWWCNHVDSLICLQLIVDLEFLEQPEDALCPRLFEP